MISFDVKSSGSAAFCAYLIKATILSTGSFFENRLKRDDDEVGTQENFFDVKLSLANLEGPPAPTNWDYERFGAI